ncbi:S1 domain-containing protein [Micromonospora sagamiensis]|uniref:hypothetical protein n=1 Tax=Micromonospora sagamiensis TaxID=47875 RepID=UPI0011A3B0AB|nr:hypothetical protein [Micromonospora sagamiensis]BCL16869.1 hypothetical protein GCM10017556_46080 [Micromonospora sagamiensis]
MRGVKDPKYSLIECRVVRHQHYGLVMCVVADGSPGYVDRIAISDEPSVPEERWPGVGDVIPCVVLDHLRDGRLRLSCRPRDVAYAAAVSDLEAALTLWRKVRDEGVGRAEVEDFLAPRDAEATLRWALRRPVGSVDHSRVVEIVAEAPGWLVDRLPLRSGAE